MADHYVKLWSSITDSSVWSRPSNTRIVWLTMLAMSDQHGFVGASVDGLARRANVPIEDVEAALEEFKAPDKRSRNRDNDGRRIQEVPRGWHILNHGYFRDLRDKEERRAYEAERKREQRAKKGTCPTMSGTCPDMSETSPKSPAMSAHEEASEAEAEDLSPLEKVTRPPKRRRGDAVRPDDVAESVWLDWVKHRKSCRAPITETVIEEFRREAEKASIGLEDAIRCSLRMAWRGFEASWLEKSKWRGRAGVGVPEARKMDWTPGTDESNGWDAPK